ncbi:MAG: mercuric reductase [Gemmatimonadetes bacterium]|nr:mercuric reductase [Gemmatimonadota bacterium]
MSHTVPPPAIRLEPADTHNARLLAQVHPAGWQNPVPTSRYHVVVIGAGTAGLVTASAAAGLGARVALIERHLMGGDCLNVGCVPSKGLIAPARAWAAARTAARDFHGPTTAAGGDFGAVMERMRRLRADISVVDGAPRYQSLGVDVFLGDGRFTAPDAIEVGGATLRFRRAVIATGARAAAPPIPGLAGTPYRTNETIFSLTTLPRRLLVIGGGPIGCEMAQAFARFGSEVTLIDRSAQVLPREDADAAQLVQDAMGRSGVRFRFHAAIAQVVHADGMFRVTIDRDGKREVLEGDELLVAIGRAPNVDGLGLDHAGVAFEPSGVTVDDRYRTTNPRVYAIGYVASRFQFTHAADFMARTVVQNALFFGRKRGSALVIPWATYTSPELAHVGHTEASARAAGLAVTTITVPFHDVDRARLDGETEGFVRVHLAAGSDRIVGATIVAEHAGDLIAEFTLCMTNGLGLGAIGRTIHPYPTQGEALRKAADAYNRTRLTPAAKRFFAAWFRFFS